MLLRRRRVEPGDVPSNVDLAFQNFQVGKLDRLLLDGRQECRQDDSRISGIPKLLNLVYA